VPRQSSSQVDRAFPRQADRALGHAQDAPRPSSIIAVPRVAFGEGTADLPRASPRRCSWPTASRSASAPKSWPTVSPPRADDGAGRPPTGRRGPSKDHRDGTAGGRRAEVSFICRRRVAHSGLAPCRPRRRGRERRARRQSRGRCLSSKGGSLLRPSRVSQARFALGAEPQRRVLCRARGVHND
jgi:hypothetical protein